MLSLLELNEHYDLVDSLNRAEDLLNRLREAAEPGAQVITGMPHPPGVKDRVGSLATDIAHVDARLTALRTAVAESEARVSPFIDSIEDVVTATIFRLRFLKGLEWKDVAAVVGGRNTAETVKKQCYRYLHVDY